MTDTPITPDPAQGQHDADTEAIVETDAVSAPQAPAVEPSAAATAAPASEPSATTAEPTATMPTATMPTATPAEPAASVGPAAPVVPAATDAPSAWTAPEAVRSETPQPTTAQPVVTQPATAQPTATQPTVPQPMPAQPSAVPQTQPTQPVAPVTHDQNAPAHQHTDTTAQQPYAQQTYAQQAHTQQDSAQPNYGQGAFGQPAQSGPSAQPAPPYGQAPYVHPQGYATAPGVPGAPKPEKKRNTGLIIATLAIGALIGGVAGAGAGVGLYAATSNNATIKTVSGPQNITVNDTNNATTITAVAAKATPSVVTISVSSSSAGSSGTGSGVVLTADGYVLTNTHVVTLDGAASDGNVSVTDNDGRIYTAKIVGTDPTTDLAVIKLDGAKDLTPIDWADSGKLNVGDTTVAIGAPLGLSGTVTDGIVSALNRSISIASSAAPKSGEGSDSGDGSSQNPFNFDFPGQGGGSQQQQQSSSSGTIAIPVIQTDASINPGNSGGALLNSKGQLIGINVAIASAGGTDSASQSGSIGVGFAIPSNLAKRISDEIIKNGSATHGLLGATVADSSSDKTATTVGALIKEVSNGGAAAAGGLKAGDVVVNFNGSPITNATDLTAQVRAMAAGSTADLTYIRDGQSKTASVTLGTLSTN